MNKDERKYLLQWIRKAEEDFLVVQQLMSSEIPIKGAKINPGFRKNS